MQLERKIHRTHPIPLLIIPAVDPEMHPVSKQCLDMNKGVRVSIALYWLADKISQVPILDTVAFLSKQGLCVCKGEGLDSPSALPTPTAFSLMAQTLSRNAENAVVSSAKNRYHNGKKISEWF